MGYENVRDYAGGLQDWKDHDEKVEDVLESILADLAATMREMTEVVACVEGARQRSPTLGRTLDTVSRLAGGVCGNCVPREYAPDMKAWMDRIQDLARHIT